MAYFKFKYIKILNILALVLANTSIFAQSKEDDSILPTKPDTVSSANADSTVSNKPLSNIARSNAAVNSVVKKHRQLFNYYYQRVWKYNQKARGSIKIRIIVHNNGSVKEIEVLSDSVKIRSLTRFILKHAKQWQFDPAKNGGSVIELVFPFIPT